jgi:thymidylate synthase ThyX
MSHDFTQEEVAVLAPHVSNVDRPIYALKNLPEEVVAVLFAYYRRSRESLRRNLLRLIQEQDIDLEARLGASSFEDVELAEAKEKARQFHEKWVVGYGHASVAEHAVVHLTIEDVSIIASKIIEDIRLALYTEKSTRYVLFDGEKCFRVPRLMQSIYAVLYEDTVRYLLLSRA